MPQPANISPKTRTTTSDNQNCFFVSSFIILVSFSLLIMIKLTEMAAGSPIRHYAVTEVDRAAVFQIEISLSEDCVLSSAAQSIFITGPFGNLSPTKYHFGNHSGAVE